jgi:hypothetical protein
VSAGAYITNNTLSTQTYLITVTQLVSPALLSSLTAGSVQVGVTDNNGDGATVSSSPSNPIYTALIDGAAFQLLLNDPKSVTVGAYQSGNIVPSESFGLPGVTFPGPAVNTSIGITLRLQVTAGDTATFSSNFVALPVPEPTTLVLGLSGLTGLAAFGRRRPV